MQSFCAVFNWSNRADREKTKSNYCFPSVVKNNGKEGLKLSKVRREKWLNFRESFNWEKAWKIKNENSAFFLPFIDFFTQSAQYQIWKANTHSILTNSNRTWTASVRVLN